LTDAGPAVGAAVGGGIEPGAAEEVILDELQVGVAAERLVVDEAPPGVRGDDDPRDPQAVAVLVDRRGRHMVVEAAPVIPAPDDRGGVPVRALHGGGDDGGGAGLAAVEAGGRGVGAWLPRGR